MRNFPISRGTVAGILKGYSGLSAAVYTEIYTGVLHNSSTKLLLFLTLGLPAICLVMMFFVRPCTPASEEDSSERGHFLFTQILSVILGVYLLTTTILNDVLSLNDAISCAFFGIMILFLLAPLAIPIKMTLYPTKPKRTDAIQASSLPEEPLLAVSSASNLGSLEETIDENDVDILLAEGEGAVMPGKKKRKPKRGEDFNFKQALVKADFWLLFLVYFLGVGSGVTVLNNLAQVGIAAGEDDTTLLLCLISFCGFVGRLGGGVVSEYFVRSRMLPRTIWMTFAHIIMIFVYLLYASAINGTLYASSALLGICFGVQYSVMVPTTSELFGLKHFGKIYSFMALGNPLGALLFSGLLAGYIYDKEAAKHHSGSFCYGPECFRLTFFVLSGVSVIGSALGVVLTVRVKPVYQMLYSSGSFRLPQTSLH
ncbi:protein NUCLEAR FUSION DEFECTIVE 4-like [Asparagus officinalis]|uniref:protein NUCLEAR FUSION DEFECTIVE 4-like n=1 Tax=Asparagus officinalis TaxID=4686 RepID=UPI00098E70AA|nr:protein NUCLEAR FUSION DEFECTIVE 4-like [Asparagus officinalis]